MLVNLHVEALDEAKTYLGVKLVVRTDPHIALANINDALATENQIFAVVLKVILASKKATRNFVETIIIA